MLASCQLLGRSRLLLLPRRCLPVYEESGCRCRFVLLVFFNGGTGRPFPHLRLVGTEDGPIGRRDGKDEMGDG